MLLRPSFIGMVATVCLTAAGGCATGPLLTTTGKTEALGAYAIPKAIVLASLELKLPSAALTNPSAAAVDGGEYSLTIKKHEVQHVPAQVVPLHYGPNGFSSDKVTVETDGSGFLKQVSVDLDDKTGEFIGKLADLGIAAAKVATVFPASTLLLEEDTVTLTVQVVVDPYSQTQDLSLTTPGKYRLPITATVRPIGAGALPSASMDTCENRICYPMLAAVEVRFDGPFGTTDSEIVLVPDPSNLQHVDLTRAALVKKTLTADFDKGVLSKVTTNKPSEALAAVQIPLDIANKLVALPAELVQLKIDTTEDQGELLKAQQDLIEAQESLLEAIEKARVAAAERQKTREAEEDAGTSGFRGNP